MLGQIFFVKGFGLFVSDSIPLCDKQQVFLDITKYPLRGQKLPQVRNCLNIWNNSKIPFFFIYYFFQNVGNVLFCQISFFNKERYCFNEMDICFFKKQHHKNLPALTDDCLCGRRRVQFGWFLLVVGSKLTAAKYEPSRIINLWN